MSELAIKEIRSGRSLVVDLCNCSINEISEDIINELNKPRVKGVNFSPDWDFHRDKYSHCYNRGEKNSITFLPESFAKLKHIERLDLRGTEIKDISLLRDFENLEYLDISYTLVSDLTPIANLTKIKFLNISYTPVTKLTVINKIIIGGRLLIHKEYDRHVGVRITGCKFTDIPTGIIRLGSEDIIRYIKEKKKSTHLNSEIKLLITGNSRSGKTSLAKYLVSNRFDKKEITTHGIYQFFWQPLKSKITVNIWDFGGQEYYHATHRLFIDDNSVHIVVWELDKFQFNDNEKTFDYPLNWWLENIRYYAPKSQMILVQNKGDANKKLEIDCKIKEHFSINSNYYISILKSYDYDTFGLENRHYEYEKDYQDDKWYKEEYLLIWKGRFLEFKYDLINLLENSAKQHPVLGYFIDIREKLIRVIEASQDKWIYISEFYSLCNEVVDDPNIESVIFYLRDVTGMILYFNNNPLLNHKVFIDKNWICENIYRILNEDVKKDNGFFSIKHVKDVLKCSETQSYDFIEIMSEFELIFRDRTQDETYFATQYLPLSPPRELSSIAKFLNFHLAFVLRFFTFIPNNVISRFIARKGLDARDKIFWKNGLLYNGKKFPILVESHYGEQTEIKVTISSSSQSIDFNIEARAVFDVLKEILQDYTKFLISIDEQNYINYEDAIEGVNNGAEKIKSNNEEWIALNEFSHLISINKKPKNIFISYSKSDKKYKDILLKHLSVLKNRIKAWNDEDILPGELWDSSIKYQIYQADIILYLVSANSISNEYIREEELRLIENRCQKKECILIPIIIDFCSWRELGFAKYNVLPEKGIPVTDKNHWTNQNEAWSNIINGISALI